MGFGNFLKDIYYLGEEKWYGFWDKVDAHFPVYKVIDKIDSVIPTFALFLIIIFLSLLFFSYSLMGALVAPNAFLKISVVDSDGEMVSGAKISIEGIDNDYYSNEFGLIDEEIKVPLNSSVSISVEKEGQKAKIIVLVDELEKNIELELPVKKISFSQKSIKFTNEDGSLAIGELRLKYSCSSGKQSATPADNIIYNGTANVSQSEECGVLTVEVTSTKYESANFTIDSVSNIFKLKPAVPLDTVQATVNLRINGQPVSEAIRVSAYRADNPYSPIDTKTSVNGQAVFNIPQGDYKFKTAMEQGYKSKESEMVSLLKSTGAKTITIELEKSVLGKISITVVENARTLSGAQVTLNKKLGERITPITSYDTNESGVATFDITEDANYSIIVTKDNYCDATTNAKIGEAKILTLRRYDGQCGNKLRARIVDQDNKPVTYAKAMIFTQTDDDLYKLPYQEKLTDYNGYVEWFPVQNSKAGEKYKVFAFKSIYSGWSEAKEFNVTTSLETYLVKLEIPLGTYRLSVKDKDLLPVQFAEVQLFEEFGADAVTGKKLIKNSDGSIEFNLKADKRVYAVIKKDGYESYTTLPKMLVGAGTLREDIILSKPPADRLVVNHLGFYKNGMRVAKVEPNQEYDAIFEIIAPKNYQELGFFMLSGKENMTKTELDRFYIKEVYAPGKKIVTTGATYNKPKGYAIDERYLNLEESKWMQIKWIEGGYVPGKIIVSAKVKIRNTAQTEERLDVGYRAWGVLNGQYERDGIDSELGSAQQTSTKQELYASLKWDYVSVGTETLCDTINQEKSFCLTATYTDNEGFTKSFTDSFDALNNSTYKLSVKIMNNSIIGFDNAKILIENPEENILIEDYELISPRFITTRGTLNEYKTGWIDMIGFDPNLSIDITTLKITPQKTGAGTVRLKIREGANLIFEKDFTVNISADKRMIVKYMAADEFVDEMPKIVSGKLSVLTVKAINSTNGLEIEGARVKIYDRFGTKLTEQTTNKLGVAMVSIPAAFPGEKLRLQIENPEYETFIKEFNISEDVVEVDPSTLTFTVNPQRKIEDKKTVRLINKTGLDLTIKEIRLVGKLKGLINEAQTEAWFENFVGKKIASQDYEEIEFRVTASTLIPQAEDISAKFEIVVTAEGKEWIKQVDTRIRVGLGKDVDNLSCLEITKNNWETTTRGATVEVSLELRNNCLVDGEPVQLSNLAATINTQSQVTGTFNAQYRTAQVELGSAYSRVFKSKVMEGEKVPVTIKFTPMAGSSGVANGSIVFEALNKTDSKAQKIIAEMKFTINYENLQDCLVLGTDQLVIEEESSGSFAIINNCKTKTDVIIDPADLQAAINTKIFSLQPGESKDIMVNAVKGQVVGAYNVLVFGRHQGTSLELAKAIKVIIEPKSGCFKLTRYIYDVYDSPFNEFDGVDRGYLRNECIQKPTQVRVKGVIPYDAGAILRMALWGGLVGGATAYFKTERFWPEGWFNKKNPNVSANVEEGYYNVGYALKARASQLQSDLAERYKKVSENIEERKKHLKSQAEELKKKLGERKTRDLAVSGLDPGKIEREYQSDIEKVNSKLREEEQKLDKISNKFKMVSEKISGEIKNATVIANQAVNQEKLIASQYSIYGRIDNTKLDSDLNKSYNNQVEKIDKAIVKNVKEWNETVDEYDKIMSSNEKLDLKEMEEKANAIQIPQTTPPAPILSLPPAPNVPITSKPSTNTENDLSGNSNTEEVSRPTGNFILANFILLGGINDAITNKSNSVDVLLNALLSSGIGYGLGSQMSSGFGGAVAGALGSGFWAWLQAQETTVDYTATFIVPMIQFRDAVLESPNGIEMRVGEVTYDYESYYGMSAKGSSEISSSRNAPGGNQNPYTGNLLYNPQALSATIGEAEVRELEFVNKGLLLQEDMRKPFVGMLTVRGYEEIYQNEYDYDYIKERAEKRGELGKKNGGILGTIKTFFTPPNAGKTIAQISSDDLRVKEKRNYERKFHLLFESYEYVDCGPKTYPCQNIELSSCDIDGKKGVTGKEAVPRIKLRWNWSEIDTQQCDSDHNPSEYIYCDSTQLTISTLKKLMRLREFFRTNSLANCPSAIDIAGTKTQPLKANALDVGVTLVEVKPTQDGATIEATVETNNNLPMSAKVSFNLKGQDGSDVQNNCGEQAKEFTSTQKFTCNITTAQVGTGMFNVDVVMTPILCNGCGNYDTTNDTMRTTLMIGSQGVAQCLKYETTKDYFEKVLAANNLLASNQQVLELISFKANLLRDGFSKDFKTDFDNFINQLAGAPPEYRTSGIRELFLSDKFEVKWPTKGSAPWEAGKYDARLLIKFKNNSWVWDNNNIESIILDLAPQGDPEPFFSIYNVAFNGIVGLDSEDGRQGYGAGYTQKTEDVFIISRDTYSEIPAQPNARNNAVTKVNVSVIKGTQAFQLLNTVPTRGNLLSIYRVGDVVDFTITPSVSVPLILNVERKTGTDAYAFYSAEVNGQPQEIGSSFISWTGIGQGCITFDGSPMQAYIDTYDYKASICFNGFEGYGFCWPLAKVSGTASFYGTFFAPQDTSTTLKMISAKDSAEFESTFGNGKVLTINTNTAIKTLEDVLNLVAQEKVCVIGGDYYWNNLGVRNEMINQINSKEKTCIPSR